MTEQAASNQMRAVPQMPTKAKELRGALKELAPMIKEAQKQLASLPLRDVPHRITGELIKCRFATSEELQRIIMKTCKGRVVINTVPIRMGNNPSVMAQVAILTKGGYVLLPSASASQSTTNSFVEKPLLAAESRAIRRAIRELGLRAEYETYDPEDELAKYQASKNAVKPAETQKEPSQEIVTDLNDLILEPSKEVTDGEQGSLLDEDHDDIPSRPDIVKETEKAKKGRDVVKVKAKAKTKKTKVSVPKSASTSKASALPKAPKKALAIKPDFEHKSWPSKQDLHYNNIILDALSAEKSRLKLTINQFIEQVFGTDNPPKYKRLTTFSNQELEMMYQFYIIQHGKA